MLNHINTNQRKTGVDISISDTVDITAQNIVRDKEGCYIMTRVNTKYICTRQQSCKICETNTVTNKRRNL